jgi:pimeloyl-ACP methyl ester carboxylesterase
MPGNELRALGELAADAVSATAARVEEMHRAIAGRSFSASGAGAVPARVAHDGVAAGVYGTVRAATRTLGRATAAAVAAGLPPEKRELSRSRRGRLAISALNGAFGDRLAEQGSDLAITMAVRHDGRDVPAAATDLSAAFPDATPRIAVFVHGLCESDESWLLFAEPGSDGAPQTYASSLQRDLGHTPLLLRYNTGLHVSENGRRLAELMDDLVAAWPVEIEEIALIGHSMGGLVARSACHHALEDGRAWTGAARQVVSLGSPHIGSPVEQVANVAAWSLAAVGETRPFATMINARSAGIKDMRFGALVDEDWRDHDADALLKDTCTQIPLLDGAAHYFVAATVTKDPQAPLGRLAGDLLVLVPSASGRGRTRRIPFEAEHGHRLGGLTHFRLLNHPAVYEQLHRWLAA